MYSARGAGEPAISCSSTRAAASEISLTGWWTVVSGGWVNSSTGLSSLPMIDNCSGRRSPRARAA